jgi:hypothetical protein
MMQAFYAAVLGWDFRALPDVEGYAMASVDGHDVAALGPKQSPDQPDAWLLYLASDDVVETAAAIAAYGGTVVLEPGDAGHYGRLCVAVDPTGATFGVWQAKDHVGAQLVNQPGGIVWEDLRSTDPAVAQGFYADVFGVEHHRVDMTPADYQTFHLRGDEVPLGGMGGFMGPPGDSHWLVYFGVRDTDAAVAAAERAGGSVAMAPFTSPYGRMAGIADPGGAVFQVMQVDESTPQPPER